MAEGFSIKWKGGGVASMTQQLTGRVTRGVQVGLTEAAQQLTDTVVSRASGRPGPEIRTGRLVGSIHSTPLQSGASSWRMQVAVDARSDKGAPYPRFLERGTSRMPAYPFLGPALSEFRSSFRSILSRATGLR